MHEQAMSDLALSTMWGIGQFPNLVDFFTAARVLGFSRFELNHAVNSAMLDGVNLNSACITSIHEPCPADISTAALKARNWLVSAPDEDDRQEGVAAIRRSIDLARELGAQAVIVHPGRVDIAPDLEQRVRDLYKQGRSAGPEYLRAKDELVAVRAAQAGINMRSVRRSVAELAEYAARMGVRLGLENRYHYYEIPLPDELDELLSIDCGDVVGYWHDVGHAQALENLRFGSHEEWLQRFAQRMVGVHLHDIVGLEDHLAAGLGCLDWDMVARYLPQAVLRTCEFQTCNSPQEVAAGVRFLIEKGCVIEA
jgi:sugar phosphate isomerase/epimerase